MILNSQQIRFGGERAGPEELDINGVADLAGVAAAEHGGNQALG